MQPLKGIVLLVILVATLPAFSQTDPRVIRVDSTMRRPGTPTGRGDTVKTAVPKSKKKEIPKDSTRLALERLPKESALRSLIVPGLGQIHNKRYWKLPFVYGGYVTLALVYNYEQKNYKQTLREVQYQLLNGRMKRDPELTQLSFENLVEYKDFFRRNRDLMILLTLAWHTFQTLDAYVDAKLFRYDIKPDLTLNVRPSLEQPPATYTAAMPLPALKLSLTFK